MSASRRLLKTLRRSCSPTLRSPPPAGQIRERSWRVGPTSFVVESGVHPSLAIKLLGRPEVRVGHEGQPRYGPRKPIELLALLCLHLGCLDRSFAAGRL